MAAIIPSPDEIDAFLRAMRGEIDDRIPNPQTPNPDEDYRFPPQHRQPPGLAPHGPIPNSQLRRRLNVGPGDAGGATDPSMERYLRDLVDQGEPEHPAQLRPDLPYHDVPTGEYQAPELGAGSMNASAAWLRRNAPFDPLGAVVGAKNGTIAPGAARARVIVNPDGTYDLVDGAHRVRQAHPQDEIPTDFVDPEGNPMADPSVMNAVSRDEGRYPPERTPLEYDIQDRIRQETEDAMNRGLGHDPSLLDLTQHEDPYRGPMSSSQWSEQLAQLMGQPMQAGGGGGGGSTDEPNLFHRLMRWQGTPADRFIRAVTPLPSDQAAGVGAGAAAGGGLMDLLPILAAL